VGAIALDDAIAFIGGALHQKLGGIAGGTTPIMAARAIPPELPGAQDITRTPNQSSLFLPAPAAPLSANRNARARLNATRSVLGDVLVREHRVVSVNRTCAANASAYMPGCSA
jgi:hypothetical protein